MGKYLHNKRHDEKRSMTIDVIKYLTYVFICTHDKKAHCME